jgi:L-threonylcarbamoyladenylate synthase
LIISLDECLLSLQAGEIVALPSETVYGLAGNALLDSTLEKIYQIKGRPSTNPLIVHVHGVGQAEDLAVINHTARVLTKHFWPGPLTIILPKKPCIPDRISAGLPTVALRAPAHPLFREVLQSLDFPLAAPSANLSNSTSPTCPQHILDSFGEKAPKVLEGGSCEIGLESTVVSLVEEENIQILRQGPISKEELEEVLGQQIANPGSSENKETKQILHPAKPSLSPGTGTIHYAPKTPLYLYESAQKLLAKKSELTENDLVVVHDTEQKENFGDTVFSILILSNNGVIEEIAQKLYATLHLADKEKKHAIHVAKTQQNHHLSGAINDRLSRAAK